MNSINIAITPRPPTPPVYLSFSARNVIPLDFSKFSPRDVRAQQSNKEAVLQCAWNAIGNRLATCGHERCVRLWTPEKNLLPKETTATSGGHNATVTALAWNPQHPELFCSSSETDKMLVFWDARKKGPIHDLKLSHPNMKMAYAPDGNSITLLDHHSTLSQLQLRNMSASTQTWDVSEAKCTAVEDITDFKFNHAGDLLFVSSKSGSISGVDYPSMEFVDSFGSHVGRCNTLDLDPKGGYMATGGSDGMVNIFNNVDMVIHRAICATDVPVYQVSYSHDGEYIALGVAGTEILIVSSVTGQTLHKGIRQVGIPASLAWHPSKYYLASCGDNPAATQGRSGWMSVIGLPSSSL